MHKRWLARLALVSFLGLSATPAMAQNGKLKKAEKMLVKYDGSDTVALAKAYDAISDAKVHPKTRDLALTWLVLAEIHRAYATDPNAESPTEKPAMASVEAYDTAIGKDPDKTYAERILEGVAGIESQYQAQATEAYESKAYDKAWPALQAVMGAQRLTRQIGRMDDAREMATLQLAVLTAVKRNDLETALKLHGELHTAHKSPTATSLALATALAEVKGAEKALEFLAPLSDAEPDDADLLKARLDHLFALGKTEDVVGLLAMNASSVGKALAITLLHARAWDRVEDLAKSAEAYANAMALGPQDQGVLRGYADVEMRRASAFDVAATATRKWRDRKELRGQRDEARQRAMDLLRESRKFDPGHLPTLELLREVYDDVRLRDREEIAALEEAIAKLKEEQGDGK